MLDNLRYSFQHRNSKKNLMKKVKELKEDLRELERKTVGLSEWVISFGVADTDKTKSLKEELIELREYLGIDYAEKKLIPKPKEEKK
jgi:radical SAM superfamily enzyme YgiQ (UPF0313 family)